MIKKACIVGNSVQNTGKECDIRMGPTSMILAVPPGLTFIESDLDDTLGWALPLFHAAPASRIYPLFGYKAPIQNIKNNQENDVVITLDDGTPVFVRFGMYNRIYETTSGGICYARQLASFLNSGMNVIEIDSAGQGLLCYTGTKDANGNKIYRGLIPSIMYGLSPQMADNKSTVYMNRFQYSFNPSEMVNNGEIFTGFAPLLAEMGLINCEFYKSGAASVDAISFGIRTECADTDIASKFGATPNVNNFIVTDKADGTTVVPTTASVTGEVVTLSKTGGFTSGHTYNVVGAASSVWYGSTPSVTGYDGSLSENSVDIVIP